MASAPKLTNSTNGPLGKRKKSKSSKGSYLSKWLDKTLHHVQDSTPSMETFINPSLHWQLTSSQFAPGFDPLRYMYGCPEPHSLPPIPTYYNPAIPPMFGPECRYIESANKSIQVQRPRLRRRNVNKAEEVHSSANSTFSNTSYLQPKNFTDSQDYTSLPPIVTSVADSNSNDGINANEKRDGEGGNARRFSDPCVRGLPDVTQPTNEDVDSESETDSSVSGSQIGSRLLTHLLDQIQSLKLANERLTKDLLETKGLLNGQYPPGFVTDMVREIRDATRVREEALYSRVRSMVLEKSDNNPITSEAKSTEKALEDIKSTLRASEADKRCMLDRIAKLEDELRGLRLTNGLEHNDNKTTNGNVDDIDTDRVRMRKELAEMRKAKLAAEEQTLKLERLVTQLRSKFNGLQLTNGPDSLPSDAEHDCVRTRRTSANSSNNSTVVFGPVTDL
ncbi:hypothetical protein ACJJTC_013800 [Scirpophaga incertulas]